MGTKQPRVPADPIADMKILGDGGLEETTGFSERTITRWKAEGALPIYAADKVAVALGKHPNELWPRWDRA